MAKKGKKKNKKNKNNQKGGFAWASSFTLKPFEAKALRELASTALASYEGRTGTPLAEDVSVTSNDPPKALWNAPVACVIMGDDSNLQYANLAALEMVNLKADEFELLCPASAALTQSNNAEPPVAAAVTLDLPSEMKGDKKYESGYKKKVLRGEEKDKDITILDASRWALEKSALVDGKFVTTTLGTAYSWEEWQVGDSLLCSPGGKQKLLVNVEELEAALEKQATVIRELKEGQGLGNKDPQVVEAVEKLLQLKDQIAAAKE